MGGDTLTTFSPSQKEVYCGIINEVLNSKQQINGFIDTIEAQGGGVINTAPGTTATRGLHFDVHVTRNSTGTFQNPEIGFPSAGNQGYRQGYFQGRTIYWPMSVSRAAVVKTKGNEAAYAQVMVEAAARTAKDLQNEEERSLLGDGSGTLGTVGAAVTFNAGVATIPLDNYQDLLKFYEGMFIGGWSARTTGATQRQIITAGDGTPTFMAVVTGITASVANPSIQATFQTGTTWTATALTTGDVLTKASDGISGAAAISQQQGPRTATLRFEPNGLDGIVNDCDTPMESGTGATQGGFCGINAPTAYGTANISGGGGATNTGGLRAWAAYVDRATTGRAFSDTIMQNMLDACMIKYGERPDIMTCSYGARTEFANSKLAIRRTVNTTAISGSTGGGYNENEASGEFVSYDGIRIVPSRYAPTSNLGSVASPIHTATYLAWNQDLIKRYQWHGVKFMDDDGLTWRMPLRTPVFESVLEHTYELVTFKRNAHAKAIAVLAQSPLG
jgi:hypothetical protein